MIFQSYLFLFAFFPVLFIVYYVFLKNEKINLADIFLAMMSLVFYAYGNVKYLYFPRSGSACKLRCLQTSCVAGISKELSESKKVALWWSGCRKSVPFILL